MKVAIGFLVVTICALALWLQSILSENSVHQAQIVKLQNELSQKSKREYMDLQSWCAKQAEHVFATRWSTKPENNTFDDYSSHFNPKLNKCFVLLDSNSFSKGTNVKTKLLLDAFELRTYVEYDWVSDPIKKYWEVPPMNCRLIPSMTDERACRSTSEWDKFVASYME